MKKSIKSGLAKMLVVALACLIAGVVSQALAEEWPEVLKKVQTKYEGLDKDVKDMTIIQEVNVKTAQGEMNQEMTIYRKGDKFRVEMKMDMSQMSGMPQMPKEMSDMKNIILSDGKETWMISPFMGKRKMSEEESKSVKPEMHWWKVVSEKAKITGREKVNERDCYVIEIEEAQKDFPFKKLWLDKDQLVLCKSEGVGAGDQKLRFMFTEFKKVADKWDMPTKTETYVDDKLMSSSNIKSYEVNKGISDDLFNAEKIEVKQPDMQEMMKMMQQQQQEQQKQEQQKEMPVPPPLKKDQ